MTEAQHFFFTCRAAETTFFSGGGVFWPPPSPPHLRLFCSHKKTLIIMDAPLVLFVHEIYMFNLIHSTLLCFYDVIIFFRDQFTFMVVMYDLRFVAWLRASDHACGTYLRKHWKSLPLNEVYILRGDTSKNLDSWDISYVN